MKVIDLLNKIANGEKPEKIYFIGKIWKYDDSINDYSYFLLDHYEFLLNTISFNYLNDEIEIIEDTPKEDKKIEQIDEYFDYLEDIPFRATFSKKFTHNELVIINKLNELIDKVNGE